MILYRVMVTRRKNQQNKPKLNQQTSRKLKHAPSKLREILDLVNLVPPETDLPDVYAVWTELNNKKLEAYKQWVDSKQGALLKEGETFDPSLSDIELNKLLVERSQKMLDSLEEQIERSREMEDWLPCAIEAVNQCLGSLSKRFQNYVWQEAKKQSLSEWTIYDAMARYTFVRESREKLRVISRFINAENPAEAAYLSPQLKTYGQILVDDDGKLYVGRDKFAAAIDGVEASRIRECAICQRLFWAGRKTQQGCSTACAHALRNRRYRARYKDYLIRQHLKESATQEASSSSKRAILKKEVMD